MKSNFIRFWAKFPLLSFILAYAWLVSLASGLFRFAPVARELELALFDKIQSDMAIDNKDSDLYKKYAPYLDQICLINLDTVLIDPETDRIKKEPLAQLLDALHQPCRQSQSVLVDYLFQPKKTLSPGDSMLLAAFRKLGNKLVLPSQMVLKKQLTLKGESSQVFRTDAQIDSVLYSLGLKNGYTTSFSDGKSGVHRYFKFAFDDGSFSSVPLLCAENSPQLPTKNPMTELHFILRNQDKAGEERAVPVFQARDILSGRLPKNVLADLVKNKFVMVGLIEGYSTKYGVPVDVFSTPVDSEMTGSLLLANAWLNLKAKINLKTGGLWLIFLLNLLIGLTVKSKIKLARRKTLSSILNTFVQILISLILFYWISLTFLKWWHIKLSLGMTLFIYQNHGLMWTWWEEQAGKFAKKLGIPPQNAATKNDDDN